MGMGHGGCITLKKRIKRMAKFIPIKTKHGYTRLLNLDQVITINQEVGDTFRILCTGNFKLENVPRSEVTKLLSEDDLCRSEVDQIWPK